MLKSSYHWKKGICINIKKGISLCTTVIGKKSLQIPSKLVKCGHHKLHFCEFKFVFSHFANSKHFVILKIPLIKKLRSNVIYSYTCSNFNVTYGKTYLHFSITVSAIPISNVTEKRTEDVEESAISEHLLQCDSLINFDHLDILASDTNKIGGLIKKGCLSNVIK